VSAATNDYRLFAQKCGGAGRFVAGEKPRLEKNGRGNAEKITAMKISVNKN
jgi:hypothetical protein